MKRVRRFVALLIAGLVLVPLVLAGQPGLDPCTTTEFFTASPIDLWNISFIRPLGGLNPPGHVFPTDHIYLYMHQDSDGTPIVVPFYSPGDLTVTSVSASQHVTAGFTDFTLDLSPCEDVIVRFMHISSLDPDVFGDTSSFEGWDLSNEYATGGETYRQWRKDTSIELSAGQELGTVGGRRGSYALDFGIYDLRKTAENVANPERWAQSWVMHAFCPFDYYERGDVLDGLLSLNQRDVWFGDADPCATVFQDLPGTAQGCWILEGIEWPHPEDPHLSLVYSSTRPNQAIISVGTSIPGLGSGLYEFTPLSSGKTNRAFEEITADGVIYTFRISRYDGVIIVTMPDAETLWIEAFPDVSSCCDIWTFT
ncbi:MAG: hypothetical protein WBC63_03055, partial [Candidatus Bipolaricaulia bacterium]